MEYECQSCGCKEFKESKLHKHGASIVVYNEDDEVFNFKKGILV